MVSYVYATQSVVYPPIDHSLRLTARVCLCAFCVHVRAAALVCVCLDQEGPALREYLRACEEAQCEPVPEFAAAASSAVPQRCAFGRQATALVCPAPVLQLATLLLGRPPGACVSPPLLLLLLLLDNGLRTPIRSFVCFLLVWPASDTAPGPTPCRPSDAAAVRGHLRHPAGALRGG